MVICRMHEGASQGRVRRRMTQVVSLALGVAMFGTVGLSGTLAQEEPTTGVADAGTLAESIINEVFALVFGGVPADEAAADEAAADEAAVSGGGDINVGGSTGGNITMGGSGGGVTVGDDSGG